MTTIQGILKHAIDHDPTYKAIENMALRYWDSALSWLSFDREQFANQCRAEYQSNARKLQGMLWEEYRLLVEPRGCTEQMAHEALLQILRSDYEEMCYRETAKKI